MNEENDKKVLSEKQPAVVDAEILIIALERYHYLSQEYATRSGNDRGVRSNVSTLRLLLKISRNKLAGKVDAIGAYADESDVARANITGLADTLEKMGYIKRVADKQDRRSVKLKITPAGEHAVTYILTGDITEQGITWV